MKNFIVLLIIIQIGMIFLRSTMIGRLILSTLKTLYKITVAIVKMDLGFMMFVYRFLNKTLQQAKDKKQKVAGAENINLENVIDFTKARQKKSK